MPTLSEIIKTYGAIPPLTAFKRPMFIGPHPDDIEFCCGALVSKMTEMGIPVTFVIATDGAAGTTDPEVTPQMLKELREKESRAAASFLGAANVEFCGLEDGGSYTVEDAMRAIAPFILKYQPDIIFGTVFPDPAPLEFFPICSSAQLPHGRDHRTATFKAPRQRKGIRLNAHIE